MSHWNPEGPVPPVSQQASWFALLDRCASASEVVRLVNLYVSAWSDSELRRLPPGSAPPNITVPTQVPEIAYTLARSHQSFVGSAAASVALERMAAVFARASQRLAELSFLAQGGFHTSTR